MLFLPNLNAIPPLEPDIVGAGAIERRPFQINHQLMASAFFADSFDGNSTQIGKLPFVHFWTTDRIKFCDQFEETEAIKVIGAPFEDVHRIVGAPASHRDGAAAEQRLVCPMLNQQLPDVLWLRTGRHRSTSSDEIQ